MLGQLWDWLTPDQADVERWAVWVAAISAGVAGVLYLLGRIRSLFRRAWSWWSEARSRFTALEVLISHELQPNSGSTIKDAVTRNSEAVEDLVGRVEHLELHLGVLAESQSCLWPALEAIAKSEPPRLEANTGQHQHRRSTDL